MFGRIAARCVGAAKLTFIDRDPLQLAGRAACGLIAVLVAVVLPPAQAQASDAVLLEFSSAYCSHCRALQPTIAELERAGVPIRRVDVQAEPQLASRFGVRQTPTLVVLSAGKEVTRLVGTHTAAEIREALAISPSGPLIPTTADIRTPSAAPPANLMPVSQSFGGEAMPSTSQAGAIERAQAATVRLRVHDGHGYGAGTGTIIDTQGEEALVLTCGHLFRETKGQGKIEVDLFVGGQTRTVSGQVIDYDADNRDIALVVIRPGFAVQPVPVLVSEPSIQNGQSVFSYGCDRGDDPSRRDTRISGINKYNQHIGASNIEIAGAPIDGRSGGGLFDTQGRLIGVCNAADYKGDVGIYTGPGSIRWQLDRVNLAHLYQASETALAANTTTNSQAAPPAPAVTTDQEVIVIVRDRSNPDATSRVMNLRPTAELMQTLQSHRR
jgi:thiol-disulfide isomerase/thioredoxin